MYVSTERERERERDHTYLHEVCKCVACGERCKREESVYKAEVKAN